MKLFSIFRSLQGESTRAGLPCVFVRLAGCPLHCTYCDTRAACESLGTHRSISEVLDLILSHNDTLVEITGGEPLLQTEELGELIEQLVQNKREVLVETSGGLDIGPVSGLARVVMDLKTPGSGECHSIRWENLEHIRDFRHELKFVVTGREDFDWAMGVADQYRLWDKADVLVSPAVGYVPAAQVADWILASHRPARMQLQLHKVLWPDSKEER